VLFQKLPTFSTFSALIVTLQSRLFVRPCSKMDLVRFFWKRVSLIIFGIYWSHKNVSTLPYIRDALNFSNFFLINRYVSREICLFTFTALFAKGVARPIRHTRALIYSVHAVLNTGRIFLKIFVNKNANKML